MLRRCVCGRQHTSALLLCTRLDDVGLLAGRGLLLGLAQLLDQRLALELQAAVEASAVTGVDELDEPAQVSAGAIDANDGLLVAEVEQGIEVDAAVREALEGLRRVSRGPDGRRRTRRAGASSADLGEVSAELSAADEEEARHAATTGMQAL